MKICITGDSILMEPLPTTYQGFDPVKSFITQANVRINNMEMVLSDYDRFASTFCGGLWLTAQPKVLDDVLKYGFNCFTFANNHTMDYSYGGMESTLSAIKAKDVPVCGAGISLAEATAPAVVDTAKGSVAVLSITSTCDDAARAGDPGHKIPARPGLNMLRHTETFTVNAAHMQALQEIADATHINGTPSEVAIRSVSRGSSISAHWNLKKDRSRASKLSPTPRIWNGCVLPLHRQRKNMIMW